MTDMAQGPVDAGPIESETPVNPYSLLDAVNRSSDTAHMAWLVFLGIMTYLMIAVAGVTHRDLLLETPVSLPILGVDIQLTQFFQFAPVVLVLFHLGLVSQLALLARKTLEFDQAIRLLETSERRTHPLRLELHNFFFVQAMGGPHRSIVMGAILHTMSWLTLVILPVVLILYIQVSFLPYHDTMITWTHRFALVFDIFVLLLIGVFLMRAETSFVQAFWRTSKSNPASFVVTIILLSLVTFFSFFVATVPGETLDRVSRTMLGGPTAEEAGEDDSDYYSGFVIPYLTAGTDGALFGIFRRNLVVTDTDLVVDRDVSEGEPTLSLRGRDLRYAKLDRSDMHQADLTGANLDYASLRGTDLRNASLHCADVSELLLSEDRELAQCTSARNADLSHAKLGSAQMTGIDANGARFEEARLEGVQLPYGILTGAIFSNAKAPFANMSGVRALGASFLIAGLEGANLKGAKLIGADFGSARLAGVMLDHAHLEGAKLQGARMEGASLEKAKLQGTDLSRAILTGADLRGASVWATVPPSREGRELADFTTMTVAPPSDDVIELMKEEMKTVDAGLAEQLNDSVGPLLGAPDANWPRSPDGAQWKSMEGREGTGYRPAAPAPTPVSTDGDTVGATEPPAAAPPASFSSYGADLTRYLSDLMCRAKWADGSVARGVVRRAVKPHFKGDLRVISRKLDVPETRAAECPGSQVLPDDIRRQLSEATERLSGH